MTFPKTALILSSIMILTGCQYLNPVTEKPAVPDPIVTTDDQFTSEENQLQDTELPLEQIQLPEGFTISLFAGSVEGARSLALSEQGTLFVGTRRQGKLYALRDQDQDGKADQIWTLDQGLNSPNGVALKDGDLYVAEINRILKYPDIETQLDHPPNPEVISDTYPSDTHHGWKYISFGPDGRLYVPVGAPCNICLSDDPIYASLTRLDVETGESEIIAKGIRNTVGFDWHPDSNDLWFTDNGADWLGNNQPGDELNVIRNDDPHFGYPFCHNDDLVDKSYGDQRSCDSLAAPEIVLGPHVAALGMEFYTAKQFPDNVQGDIFIAEHGSWNRNPKIGYRLTRVEMKDDQAGAYEVFAEGWLQEDGSHWGRPVDLETMADGSLLISDDYANAIYRITYQSPAMDR